MSATAASIAGLIITILALIGGWLMASFTKGRALGNFEQLVTDNFKAIETRFKIIELNVEANRAETDKLKIDHANDMKDVRAIFQNSSGGQKFMTFPDHDATCLRNTKPILDTMAAFTDAVRDHTQEFKKMGDKFHVLSTEVAVLKERRIEGVRQDNPKE